MGQNEFRARLQELDEACDRVGSNLLELERHPAVALLEVSALAGVTAREWVAARETLAELFVAHRRLRDALDDLARQARSRLLPRVDDLMALIEGPSIVVSDDAAELADRDLLARSRIVVRRTPAQLIADMSPRYERVKRVVLSIADVWDDLIPRLRHARQRILDLEPGASEYGLDATVLTRALSDLRTLSELVLSDPLGVDRSAIETITSTVDAFEHELAAHGALAARWPDELADARRLLAAAQRAVQEAVDLAEHTRARIVGAEHLEQATLPTASEQALERIAGESGGSPATRRELIEWRTAIDACLTAARQHAEHCRSLLAERDELRGRLDAAFAKAAGLGLLEDPALSETLEHAHEALFVAPTDLAVARARVERYVTELAGRRFV